MDTRNLVSFAAANHYMVSKTPHQLLINSDATQFQVGGLLTKKMAVKIKIGRKSSIDPMKVLPEKNEELSAFFIKYYAIMSAGGYLSDPIFIIADPSMDAGDIDVYDVKGLGIGIDASNKGTLVFCKDRTLCNEYYDWLIEHKILDFVHYIKNQCELEDDDLTWYTLDGESKQLSPFTSERIIKILSDNNIVVGKPPGSSTRITQPCDAYQFFKAIKTALRAKKKNAINPVLEARLTTIFGQHEAKKNTKMKPKHKKMAIQGLLDILMFMNQVINPDIIRLSFAETGMYDLNTQSYDLNKIISKFKVNLDPNLQLDLVKAVRKLAKIIGDKGELTEADMNAAGIPPTIEKDHLTLCRRRYVTLTNPHVLKRENEKRKCGPLRKNNSHQNKAVKNSKRKTTEQSFSKAKRQRKKEYDDEDDISVVDDEE
jgi:hypothetical protein